MNDLIIEIYYSLCGKYISLDNTHKKQFINIMVTGFKALNTPYRSCGTCFQKVNLTIIEFYSISIRILLLQLHNVIKSLKVCVDTLSMLMVEMQFILWLEYLTFSPSLN